MQCWGPKSIEAREEGKKTTSNEGEEGDSPGEEEVQIKFPRILQ